MRWLGRPRRFAHEALNKINALVVADTGDEDLAEVVLIQVRQVAHDALEFVHGDERTTDGRGCLVSLVPKPGELVDPRAISDRCDRVEVWASSCDDVSDLRLAIAGLAAIDEYLARTSIDGRERIAASMLRLKVRIGKLLGPARPAAGPGRGKPSEALDGFSRDERHEFRKLAANEELVEKVIAESSDERPASTARVIHEIRRAADPEPADPSEKRGGTPRAPDAYGLVDGIFRHLKRFNDACDGLADRELDFDLAVRTALGEATSRGIVGGIWLNQVARAIEHLQQLRELKEQPLRSVQ